jgi:type III pantothenate kinase
MAMNAGRWVLDVGNTRVKFAHRTSEGEMFVLQDDEALERAQNLEFVPEAVLVAASGELSDAWKALCQRWTTRCIHVSASDALFFPRNYTPPESLGLDRIANALAVGSSGTWAIVDAGTCITCDLVKDGVFCGGSIAPGLAMRLHAMHQGTARLPRWEVDNVEDCALGTTTSGSMGSGALHGARLEVQGRIAEWHAAHPELRVAVTGGDAPRLAISTSVPIFADPFLTLRGYHLLLNRMLP